MDKQGKGKTAKKRQLSRKSTEDQVSKAIADNFKGWSATQTDGITRNNLTLRQRLAQDKHEAHTNAGSKSFGARYYKKIKQEYESEESPGARLKVKDASMEVDEKLIKALS
eukprot:8629052-Lingulodinium_polyedra.AAC.1